MEHLFTTFLPEILQYILAGFFGWAWWSMRRIFVTRAELEAKIKTLETRQQEADAKNARIQQEIETRQYDMKNKMSSDMAQIKADIANLMKTLQKIETAQEKLHDRLLDICTGRLREGK